MIDTWWTAVDRATGEECQHKHHTRDHALRCARARFTSPAAEKRSIEKRVKGKNRLRDRYFKTGAMIEYEDK